MNMPEKCGYIAIVGKPNVGKSTLLNQLVGQKISIMTPKPQTTRLQILGINTQDNAQAIYVDTPGIHRDQQRTMNRYMNRLASSVITDANIVLFVIEALRWSGEDELVLEKIQTTEAPVILVINKVDTVKDKNQLLPFIEKIKSKYAFAQIVPLSAKRETEVKHLQEIIFDLLPLAPHLFPDDQVTDKNERFQAAELIREKVIRETSQELPYCTAVGIESMKMENNCIHIHAIIWVEREGQKVIIIGKQGKKLKKIGTEARLDIEKLLGHKVFLQLWVKVKEDWTDSEAGLRNLGYI